MLDIIERPDRRDWYALPFDPTHPGGYVRRLRDDLRGLRIAFTPTLGYGDEIPDDAVIRGCRDVADLCGSLGANVEEADPPLGACADVHATLWRAFSHRLVQMLGPQSELLDASLKALAQAGSRLTGDEVLQAMLARGEIGAEVGAFFARYHLLICPVFRTPAPTLAAIDNGLSMNPRLTSWCNQLGLPAASLPCGADGDGLPLAAQVVGGQFADALVLGACHALEQALAPPAPVRRSAGLALSIRRPGA